MDLEAVVCLYNGIWLHHKTEWTNALVSDINGPGDVPTKQRKSEEEKKPRASLMGQIEKSVKMNSSIKQKQTHRLRKETSGHQRFKVGWRERETGRLGLIYNCNICKIDNPQGTVLSTLEWPIWGKTLKKSRQMYNWSTLLYSRT